MQGKHGFSGITAYSAAAMLMEWTEAHGRPPQCQECRPRNGLMFWHTYFKIFDCRSSGFSAVLEYASAVYNGANLTELHLHRRPITEVASAAASAVKMRTCLGLGCDASFPEEGKHVRFCTICRKRKIFTDAHGHSADPWLEPALTRVQLKRLGFGRGGLEEDVLWGIE